MNDTFLRLSSHNRRYVANGIHPLNTHQYPHAAYEGHVEKGKVPDCSAPIIFSDSLFVDVV